MQLTKFNCIQYVRKHSACTVVCIQHSVVCIRSIVLHFLTGANMQLVNLNATLGTAFVLNVILQAEATYVKWGDRMRGDEDEKKLWFLFCAEMTRIYEGFSFLEEEDTGYNAQQFLTDLYTVCEAKYYALVH